ncbi:MAG: HEAT repeat domain-containing protein, partial [Verrucomicrobiales bacterium]
RTPGGIAGEAGDLFISLFNNQTIVRTRVTAQGATFQEVETEEFLAIDDPDAHLTDVFEDADGTLMVVDTGGWFRNGCPSSQIAKPEVAGAIYRIRRAGPYPEDRDADPRGLEVDWAKASPTELAQLLGDDRFAVRERAIGELGSRGAAALGALKEALGSESVETRRGAVWALTRIGNKEKGALELVRVALKDREGTVRHSACNSLWRSRDAGAREGLVGLLLGDGEQGVQMAAARALGRVGDAAAVPALLEYCERPLDRVREHAAIYALIEIDAYAATAGGLAAGNMPRQRRALWALSEMKSSALKFDAVLPFLDAQDEDLAGTAIEIFKAHPDWASAAAAEFARWLERGALTDENLAVLGELVPAMLADAPMRKFVGELLTRNDGRLTRAALEIIATGPAGIAFAQSWEAPLRAALAGGDRELLAGAIGAVAKIDSGVFDDRLREIADDGEANSLVRVLALGAVADPKAAMSKSAFDLLTGIFQAGDGATQRAEAAAMFAGARLNLAQRREVAALIPGAGPVELGALLKVFARTRDAETGLALVAALKESGALGSVAVTELQRLLNRFPPEVYAEAQPLVDDLLALAKEREVRLEALAANLESGDAGRGKALFETGMGACITCHVVGGAGRAVGPELSRIGRIRTGRDLLESILYPSATLARDFEPFEIKTRGGETLLGVIQSESADTVQFLDVSGIPRPLARSEILEIRPGAVSLMPQGLDQAMTPEQLVDLVVYLDSLE